MSVTAVTIIQDNIIPDGSNLLCVHSPLIFIADAEYTGTVPDVLYAHLYDYPGLTVLGSYKMIPYLDSSSTHRQFMFVADPILRGFMEDFPDFVQSGNSLVAVADITKQFYLVFSDSVITEPDPEDISCGPFMALIAARQFGESPNADDIYDNDVDTYYGAVNKPVCVYFYNDSDANVLTVSDHIDSAEMTGSFTRNNCPVGEEGSAVTFTKTYTSYISKADLDAQVANFNAEGQAYANANGTCTLPIFNYAFTSTDGIAWAVQDAYYEIYDNQLLVHWEAGGNPAGKFVQAVPESSPGNTLTFGPGTYRMTINVVSKSGTGAISIRGSIPDEPLTGTGLKTVEFTVTDPTNFIYLQFLTGSTPPDAFEAIVDNWKLIQL